MKLCIVKYIIILTIEKQTFNLLYKYIKCVRIKQSSQNPLSWDIEKSGFSGPGGPGGGSRGGFRPGPRDEIRVSAENGVLGGAGGF